MKSETKRKMACFFVMVTFNLLALVLIMATISFAYADDSKITSGIAPDWNFSGTLTNRFDYYGQSGNAGNSLFPNNGEQYYSELNLNFNRRISAYENVSGNLFGLLNDSDYRSNNDGFSLERGQVTWEKGDAALPFRARFGDFFGFFSPRTIQRTLKGSQLEFQPAFSSDINSSVLLFSGVTDATFREFNDGKLLFSGASLFLESDDIGSYTLNLIHNQDKSLGNAQQQEQLVASLAGEQQVQIYQQEFNIEGEVGLFNGDHSPGFAAVENVSDTGVFLRFSGRDMKDPFSYALSLERYGENYRPKGGTIIPDRSSVDFNLAYTLEGGLVSRLRSQRFEDALESGNSTVSYVNGLNFSGRLANPIIDSLSIYSDTFVQRTENQGGFVNTNSFQSNLNLAMPLGSQLTGNFGMLYRTLEDRFNNSDSSTVELRGSVDRKVTFGSFYGRVSPGLILRQIDSFGIDSVDITPSISMNIGNDKHDLSFSYQSLIQQRDTGATDLVTHNAGMAYAYRTGRHHFGVDVLFNASEPDPGSSSDNYRVGAFYTFSFDRPARQKQAQKLQIDNQFNDALGVLMQFGPGSSLMLTRKAFTDAGVSSGVRAAGSTVYDTRVIDTIDQRQRLVVLNSANRVEKIAVVINFDDTGRPDSAARVFERVREVLIRRLGPPQTSYAKGEFDSNFTADVAAGRFTRVDEWNTATGVLRFGIPQRLDGQVRIEIQQAERFSPPQRTLWSIEEVR